MSKHDEVLVTLEDVLQNKAPLDSDQAGPLGEGGPNESGSAGKELSQGYRKLMEIIEANQTRAEKILMKVPMMEITGYKTGILCSTARGSKQPVTVFNDIKVYKSTISDVYVILGSGYAYDYPGIGRLEETLATQAGRASGVSDTRESKMASHNSISRALGAAGGGSGPSAQELADLVPRDPGDAYKPKKGEAAASAGTAPEEVDLDAALRSMR